MKRKSKRRVGKVFRMDKLSKLELILRFISNISAIVVFWATVLIFTIWFPHVLGWFERLSLGAALSWAAFVNMEGIGMIIMSLYKEKWQKEAHEVGREKGIAEGVLAGRAEGVAEGREIGREEGIAEGVAAGIAAGRAEARAEYEETIRRLERQLKERLNGDSENGNP